VLDRAEALGLNKTTVCDAAEVHRTYLDRSAPRAARRTPKWSSALRGRSWTDRRAGNAVHPAGSGCQARGSV